ncbi:WSN domain-containing protein [Caenorhabditis elegans]|uniref:WSN domain-containing protein n=1 Tax=Caenorhabditis elegans TaxID=6239 RepID=Q9U1P0_CAEEL|nr:WSN domain-containing protein [Caenorhabditis elegans]CAB63419.1 WSN domain-containing protein [Caenorhabditis elegans]|eukprot:NP_507605.1 Uncharacterized protein CELE_ZK262.4 [Caenorhabditis elegans]
MLLFPVFGLTAAFEPDVLLSPPAPFFSFKYISTINDIAKGIDLQVDLMNREIPKLIGDVAHYQMCKFLPKCHINSV